MRFSGFSLAGLLLVSLSACSGSSNQVIQGPTMDVAAPQIACPSPATTLSMTGDPVAVSYQPTVSQGAAPVTSSCKPASGSMFPVGDTAVTCDATDAQRRTATCSFTVHVEVPPKLSVTRFVAFGDSITWGEDGQGVSAQDLFSHQALQLVGSEYPTVARQLLASRYTSQTISVDNEGKRAESAGDPDAFSRFRGVVGSGRYDAVFLMEGANDIWGGTGGNPLGIPSAIAGLRRMIGEARLRGVRLLLATVPPEDPAGVRGHQGYQTVPRLNTEIRNLASSEGVALVDVFQAFGDNLSLIGADGLHPNAAGYAKIADAFVEVARAAFESAPRTARPLMAAPFTRPH